MKVQEDREPKDLHLNGFLKDAISEAFGAGRTLTCLPLYFAGNPFFDRGNFILLRAVPLALQVGQAEVQTPAADPFSLFLRAPNKGQAP